MSILVTKAAGIIEEDKRGSVMWTWLYPSMTDEQKRYILGKCGCAKKEFVPFVFCRFSNLWFYIRTSTTSEKSILSQVCKFSVAIIAADFNPEKYGKLLTIFCQQYDQTGSPVTLLEQYLKVFTQGSCQSNSNGIFKTADFDPAKSSLSLPLKEVIELCGIESILIYTCVLLRRRLVVYHNDLETLLHLVRAIPTFAMHRCDWSILHPWVENNNEEIDDVNNLPYYIIGTTDSGMRSRKDLYDMFVDLTTGDITTASHAKETFVMCKIHKDVANLMMKLSEDKTTSNSKLIKGLEEKTQEIIEKLRSFADDEFLSVDFIRDMNLNKSTESFLISLGLAEKLIEAI